MADPAPIRVLVRLRADDAQLDAAEQILNQIAGPSRANPDCREFRIFRDKSDSSVFTLYEHWDSFEANRAHARSDYMRKFESRKDIIFATIDPTIIDEISAELND